MSNDDMGTAVIAGVGPGLGAALCKRFAGNGYNVAGLARTDRAKAALNEAVGTAGGRYLHKTCDLTDEAAVTDVLGSVVSSLGPIEVLVYNAGTFLMKSAAEITATEFRNLWEINCLGAFLCARSVLPGMSSRGRGAIVFTGATAALRGGARFGGFAASKFALRGLAQSLAREYGPQGIHVAHVVVDGIIDTARTRAGMGADPETSLDPEAIAETYLHLIRQHRSAWTHELDLRPDTEKF